MPDRIGTQTWIEFVLLAVLAMAYVGWFLHRHRPSPRWGVIVLEIFVVVVLVLGLVLTAPLWTTADR